MVILGLGSNRDDKLGNLKNAISALEKILHNIICSPVYESPALLPHNAPKKWNSVFFNMAIRGETKLSPHELLEHIKKLEVELGRKPRGRWGPREIDIDILAYDDVVINETNLIIPHVYLLERDFALVPLADIEPDWVYPVKGDFYGITARELAKNISKNLTRVKNASAT